MIPGSEVSDQLTNLMTYTVFHIGVYITLGGAVVAGGTLKKIDHPVLKLSLICFLLAGACGGIIAGNIPLWATWAEFKTKDLGPFGQEWFKFEKWARIEHYSFWIGVLIPASLYLFKGMAAFGRKV